MKKIIYIVSMLLATVFFSGCGGLFSNPLPPKDFKGVVDSSVVDLSADEQKKLFNKSLHQVRTVAAKNTKISPALSNDNCFEWGVLSSHSASKRGHMKSCYQINDMEITLQQDFKCFERKRGVDTKEITCSFGIVPITDKYVKFVDFVSEHLVTAYNENLKAYENKQKLRNDPNRKFYYIDNEFSGWVETSSGADEFGNSVKGKKECKRLAVLRERFQKDRSEILRFNTEGYIFTELKQGRMKISMDQGALRANIQMGKIASSLNINDATLSSSQNFRNKSIAVSRDIQSVMVAFNTYLGRYSGIAEETYLSRMFLIDAFLYTQNELEPALRLYDCFVGFNDGKMDLHHFEKVIKLIQEKNPKANRLLLYILNNDEKGASEYLMSDRRIKEAYNIMKAHYEAIRKVQRG